MSLLAKVCAPVEGSMISLVYDDRKFNQLNDKVWVVQALFKRKTKQTNKINCKTSTQAYLSKVFITHVRLRVYAMPHFEGSC